MKDRYQLALFLLLMAGPGWAAPPSVAVGGRGVSEQPTPLAAPLAEYEELIETMAPPPPDPVPSATAPSRRPRVQVIEGGGEIKRGRSRENGVTVYRGPTPAQQAPATPAR